MAAQNGHSQRVPEQRGQRGGNRVTQATPNHVGPQGARGRSGDSANRGAGGWFNRRTMGQPGK